MRKLSAGFWLAAAMMIAMDATGVQMATPPTDAPLTVIWADRDDPYRDLAQEIAEQDALPLADSLQEALAQAPAFLLWVVSPGRLSDKRMAEPAPVAMGLITGSSIKMARDLYRRARDVHPGRAFVVNTYNRPNHRSAAIIAVSDGGQEKTPLTKDAVIERLTSYGYLVFNGHGGATYLKLDEDGIRIQNRDLPPLHSLIVESHGCQTLRPWERESIALAFVDKGAAAFAGYSISPMAGWGTSGLAPFRLSWPGFPIGMIALVTDDALRANARISCYHLLGDPRIAFRADPPYAIDSDLTEGNTRTIAFRPKSKGVLPIRIEGGARYDFVAISGVTAVSRNDIFANARLQMTDLGEDKLILLDSNGETFVCTLAVNAPVLWRFVDPILDSLDAGLLTLYAPDSGTHTILAVLAVLALVAALLKARTNRPYAPAVARAIGAGLALAACHALYALLRLDHVTVTANPVHFYPVSVVSTFLMVASGALFHSSAKTWKGKLSGALLGAGVPVFATLFILSMTATVDMLTAAKVGIAPWTPTLALATAIASAVQCALCLAVFKALGTGGTYRENQRPKNDLPN